MRDVQYVLAKGIENRRRRHHSLNSESSRSHAMFSVYLDAAPLEGGAKEGGGTRYGRFSILDLAGSENVRLLHPHLHPHPHPLTCTLTSTLSRGAPRTPKEANANTPPHPGQVRATQSQGAGLKEAGAINRSLFALGQATRPRLHPAPPHLPPPG